jgi:hypothetical protein
MPALVLAPVPAPAPTPIIPPPSIQKQPTRLLTFALENVGVMTTSGPDVAMNLRNQFNNLLTQIAPSYQIGFGMQDTIELHRLGLI